MRKTTTMDDVRAAIDRQTRQMALRIGFILAAGLAALIKLT